MASKDDYAAIAQEIANYFNAYSLAFKTYQVSDLDKMIKVRAGEGARLSTATVAEEFETILLKRGFMCFPALADAEGRWGRLRSHLPHRHGRREHPSSLPQPRSDRR